MESKKIEVCIGTGRAGDVRVRLSLITLDAAGGEVREHFHSMTLLPGDDPTEARKLLETHLGMPSGSTSIPDAPWPPIPDNEWAKVLGVLPHFHTPERVTARKAQLAAQRAAAEEAQAVRQREREAEAAAADAAFKKAVEDQVAEVLRKTKAGA